jgi:hypothetical protein
MALPTAGLFGPGDIVQPLTIDEQKVFSGIEFPLVLSPNPGQCDGGCSLDDLTNWVNHSTPVIDKLLLKVRLDESSDRGEEKLRVHPEDSGRRFQGWEMRVDAGERP